MSKHVFERANLQPGAFFVAGCAAIAQWCPAEITVVHHLPGSMVPQ